jgi:hypothetical protein
MGRQKKWEASDTINAVSAAINSIIAICTIVALYFSYQSMTISENSLQLTKQTIKESDSTSKINFDLTKRSVEAAIKLSQFADSNYSVTKKGIENSNRNYENSFKISEKSFNETVSQFNKSNTPYIQIEDFNVSNITESNPVFVKYAITNLTNIPVKITKQRSIVIISKTPFTQADIEKEKYAKNDNHYLIKGAYLDVKTTITDNRITKKECDIINHKDFYIFLFKEIVYENLVTKKIRHYKFQVKLKKTNGSDAVVNNTFVEFLYNENYDE